MLDTATVSNFLTKVQELVSVENLVGKHLLQFPFLIMDLPEVGVSDLVRCLCGVRDMVAGTRRNLKI